MGTRKARSRHGHTARFGARTGTARRRRATDLSAYRAAWLGRVYTVRTSIGAAGVGVGARAAPRGSVAAGSRATDPGALRTAARKRSPGRGGPPRSSLSREL